MNTGHFIAPSPIAQPLALALLLLVGLAGPTHAQDGLMHPGAKKPAPSAPAPTAVHATQFPRLEPFRQSKFWKKAIDHIQRAGLTDDAVASMNQEFTVQRMANELADKSKRDAQSAPPPDAPRLGEKANEDRRLWLWEVPIVLAQIEPLWNAAEWSGAQFQQAGVAARFFAEQEGPPRLKLVEGEHASNQAQLEMLLAWFRSEVARPESYALMLITDAEGPWLPVEAKAATSLKSLGELQFGADRLVLRRDEKGGGPWMLQLMQGKKPLWTRALTRLPVDSPLTFAGDPIALGEHGWVLRLDYGETLALYLDAKAQPLFYFTAW